MHRSTKLLEGIDEILAMHPVFADAEYICGQMQVAFERRLDVVATRIPGALALLEMLADMKGVDVRRVLSDTVVRYAIQHAHTCIETGKTNGLSLDDCNEVFLEAVADIESGDGQILLERSARRVNYHGTQSSFGWVWNEESSRGLCAKIFRRVTHRYYETSLCTPTSEDVVGLRNGQRLLVALLPALSASALAHVRIVALFPPSGRLGKARSSSHFNMVGTIFLSRELLNDPWRVAEQLLHESLHQKLYDFRHGHSLFEGGRPGPDPSTVVIPWNSYDLERSNHWDHFRVFAAFHVYVHLAALCAAAECRWREGQGVVDGMAPYSDVSQRFRVAVDRARYLGASLEEACWNRLGPAGRSLHQWLTNVLRAIDLDPRRGRGDTPLLLDLYRREGERVAAGMNAEANQTVAELLADELRLMRSLLSELDDALRAGFLERFNTAIARSQLPRQALPKRFLNTRVEIANTVAELYGGLGDGDGQPRERAFFGSVDEMIRRSSLRLSVESFD